jgi:hypothetical protein
LEQFRAKTKRLQIHPVERSVLGLVALHLVFLPWALGGVRTWAQVISLGLGALAFVVALLPRTYTADHTGAAEFRLIPWPKLLRFPLFWLGGALIALVIVQACNPGWSYRSNELGWWMERIDSVRWLPAGVAAPFEKGGQGSALLVLVSAWLTVCTVWVGFTRRRSLQVLLLILAGNGLALALLGLAQRMMGNGKIFWFYESPNPVFFSSFTYKNFAGSYLLLPLALTCGLAAWYYLRGLRRLEKSNPSGVLAFFATCVGVSVLTSYARGATLTMLAFLLLCVGAFVVHQIYLPKENRKPLVALCMVAIFGFFLKTGLTALNSRLAWSKIEQAVSKGDSSMEARSQATIAASEMLGEHWVRGVGAGSFRFLFPLYQHRHPELKALNPEGGAFWINAHNDLLQFPIEYGAAGVLIFLAGLGWCGISLCRSYFWENPLSATGVLICSLMLVYGRWEFLFQCPAVLITWSVVWVIALQWARFEESGAKG